MRDKKRAPIRLGQLLHGLYSALHEGTGFEQPLRLAAAAFRSHMSGLHSEDFNTGRGSLTLIGSLSQDDYLAYAEAYSRRWSGQNLWIERSLDGFLGQGFQHGEAVVSEQELVTSPYYRHFLRPLDVHYGMGINIGGGDPGKLVLASFHRDRNDHGFDDGDIALIKALRPHLINAHAIHQRIQQAEDGHRSLQALCDHARLGMILVDSEGHLRHCNPSALAQLERRAVLAAGGCRRSGLTESFRRRLVSAIAQLFADPACAPSIRIDAGGAGAGGQTPGCALVLHLHPLPPQFHGRQGQAPHVLGFLSELDPAADTASVLPMITAVLGLTAGEARVALALRERPDVEHCAHVLGITLSTARSHLKRIYQKLGISRQGELLLIVERCLHSRPRG
ncbi:MAG: hypothetical protein M0Q42_12090 [Xanthomonadales bacterium]|nr:hypothetical protein [Xanthomonadales bacterium]